MREAPLEPGAQVVQARFAIRRPQVIAAVRVAVVLERDTLAADLAAAGKVNSFVGSDRPGSDHRSGMVRMRWRTADDQDVLQAGREARRY